MTQLLNQAWIKRGLIHLPINAVLTFTWVTLYEQNTTWTTANSPESLTPLLWAVGAQTVVSLLTAARTEDRWPRYGRLAALAVGQVAVPLLLFGSYLLAQLGTR
ncbi:MAG: hypothetical protein ACO3BA_04845 [Schleiferiaceae bacterium]